MYQWRRKSGKKNPLSLKEARAIEEQARKVKELTANHTKTKEKEMEMKMKRGMEMKVKIQKRRKQKRKC